MEKIITDLIYTIRKNSKRPYSESIWNQLQKDGHKLDFDTVAETLRALQHAGLIENRPHKGEESSYVTDGAVAVSASIDGKESFKPPDEDNDGDSDISSDTESEELEEDSHSSVGRNPTFSGKRFQWNPSSQPNIRHPSN